MDKMMKSVYGLAMIGTAALAARVLYLKGKADAVKEIQELDSDQQSVSYDEDDDLD